MRYVYIILLALFLMDGAMAQWIPQNSGTPNSLNSVYFTDENTGYVAGDSGVILKTIDGGTNWILQVSGTIHNLKSIHFPTNQTGYIAGDSNTMLKTTDYGATWNILPNTMQMSWKSVFFTDINTGYAVGWSDVYIPGDSSKIFKTTNGGNTWNVKPCGTSVGLNAVHFADSDTGYVVGGDGSSFTKFYRSVILKTTNGGDSWNIQMYDSGGATRPYHSVFFVNPNIGCVVGGSWGAVILKTTDGGNTWTGGETNPDPSAWLISVFMINADTGYAVGDGIYRTTNGGEDWWKQECPSVSYGLHSVYFTSDEVGYTVGYPIQGQPGVILKTTNGGGYPVAINNHNPSVNTINIFPNPASTTLTLETPSHCSLSIHNTSGQQFLQQQITEPKTTIDVSKWKSGVYVVKVVGENGVQVGKFVKK